MSESESRHRLLHYGSKKWDNHKYPVSCTIMLIPKKFTKEPGAYEVEAVELTRGGRSSAVGWVTTKSVRSGTDIDKALDDAEKNVDEAMKKHGLTKATSVDVA